MAARAPRPAAGAVAPSRARKPALDAREDDPLAPEKVAAARARALADMRGAAERGGPNLNAALRHVLKLARKDAGLRAALLRWCVGRSSFAGVFMPPVVRLVPRPGRVAPFGPDAMEEARRLVRKAAEEARAIADGDEGEAREALWREAARDAALQDAMMRLTIANEM